MKYAQWTKESLKQSLLDNISKKIAADFAKNIAGKGMVEIAQMSATMATELQALTESKQLPEYALPAFQGAWDAIQYLSIVDAFEKNVIAPNLKDADDAALKLVVLYRETVKSLEAKLDEVIELKSESLAAVAEELNTIAQEVAVLHRQVYNALVGPEMLMNYNTMAEIYAAEAAYQKRLNLLEAHRKEMTRLEDSMQNAQTTTELAAFDKAFAKVEALIHQVNPRVLDVEMEIRRVMADPNITKQSKMTLLQIHKNQIKRIQEEQNEAAQKEKERLEEIEKEKTRQEKRRQAETLDNRLRNAWQEISYLQMRLPFMGSHPIQERIDALEPKLEKLLKLTVYRDGLDAVREGVEQTAPGLKQEVTTLADECQQIIQAERDAELRERQERDGQFRKEMLLMHQRDMEAEKAFRQAQAARLEAERREAAKLVEEQAALKAAQKSTRSYARLAYA